MIYHEGRVDFHGYKFAPCVYTELYPHNNSKFSKVSQLEGNLALAEDGVTIVAPPCGKNIAYVPQVSASSHSRTSCS
jgi:hypothetical protein